MKIEVVDLKNQATGEMDLDETIFGAPIREHLFWEVINWQRARRRAGTHKTQGRSEVKLSGRKPWRQKGTGRARAGAASSPIWVGGGVIFGPQPRDYSYSLPKKKRRAALRSALSLKMKNGQIKVVEDLELPEIKTKLAVQTLQALNTPKALLVDSTTRNGAESPVTHNETLRLSVRNLKNAKYLAAEGLNVEDVLRFDFLVLSRSAVEQIQETLKS